MGLSRSIELEHLGQDDFRPFHLLDDDAQPLDFQLMQNWFGYSDPAMEESLYETTILRQFSGLHLDRIPDETTILNFHRLLDAGEVRL